MSNPLELSSRGINMVESVGNWLRGIGLRTGFVPLAWDHDLRPGLVWRIPDPGVRTASVLSQIQGILVREFEQAVVLHNGQFYADLSPGVYDIRKMPIKDYVDVVWLSTQTTQHKWGVGRVLNCEDITVGAHGYLFLRIDNARKFVLELLGGRRQFTQRDLEDWVFNTVSAVMRTQIAATTVRDLMHAHEEFVRACTYRLEETFGAWGITFQNLVVNQYDIPQEYRDVVARVTMARYERDTRLIDADAEAESMRIRSRAEAEARLTIGSADVELMARMQAFGLDPIRLKQIEALSEYARLAAQSGGGGGGSDMVNMMMLMQMQRLMSDPGMPGDAKQFLTTQFPTIAGRVQQLEAPAAPTAPPPPPKAPTEPPSLPSATPDDPPADDERTRIQTVLDNLDERLAAGELSESTYERLYAKWEKRLAELDG